MARACCATRVEDKMRAVMADLLDWNLGFWKELLLGFELFRRD